jgi:hypothetical protein
MNRRKFVKKSLAAAGWRRASPALRLTFRAVPPDLLRMPLYGRHFEPGQLQFITTNTYRRSRLFTCQRFCWTFVETDQWPWSSFRFNYRNDSSVLAMDRLARPASNRRAELALRQPAPATEVCASPPCGSTWHCKSD